MWWPALTEAGLGEYEEVQRVQDVAEPDRDHEHVASLIVKKDILTNISKNITKNVTISSPNKPNLLSWLLVGEDDDEEDDIGEDGEEAVDEHDHPNSWFTLVRLHIIHPGGTVHGSRKAYRDNRCSFHLFEFTSHYHTLSIGSIWMKQHQVEAKQQFEKQKQKLLYPVGSTVCYEVINLFTGSV